MQHEIELLCGSPEEPETCIFRDGEKDIYLCRVPIAAKKKEGGPIKILFLADVHLNLVDEADESNEELMETVKYRKWNAGGQSIAPLKKVMACTKEYDLTVVGGDTLDYLSHGAMAAMEQYIWQVEPNCLAVLGGHELVYNMQTGKKDKEPLEEKQRILEKFWKHDMYYTSRVIKDKVMAIQLDNSRHRYWERQIAPLRRDLALAREKGWTVLVFQHEPISTGKPEDRWLEAFCPAEGCPTCEDYYAKPIGCPEKEWDAATQEVYALLTQNADVIQGIFCGHEHGGWRMQIKASYPKGDGTFSPAEIPQQVQKGLVYDGYVGHAMEICIE